MREKREIHPESDSSWEEILPPFPSAFGVMLKSMTGNVPLNELGEFLKKRRAELSPRTVGLPESDRPRRVAGLRREEVAQTQVAADALGLAVRAVDYRLGDSRYPQTPPHGGSMTMASVGSATLEVCNKLRQQAIRLAVEDEKSPLHGVPAGDIVVRGGRLHVQGNPARGETYQRLLTRNNRERLEANTSFNPPRGEQFSISAYSATFTEVAVDATLGLVRVRRMLSVYDAGRIISPKLADSQALGGMVGGIGAALLEHTVTDHRDGRIVNANLADYLVPVNADIPDLRAIYLDGEDMHADALGVKGLAELVICGVAPAIANAVFNATGRRVRELPITAEALL
jgi:xanthine dehydrogenase YagR molybdenum-binding subunit